MPHRAHLGLQHGNRSRLLLGKQAQGVEAVRKEYSEANQEMRSAQKRLEDASADQQGGAPKKEVLDAQHALLLLQSQPKLRAMKAFLAPHGASPPTKKKAKRKGKGAAKPKDEV